MSFLPRLLSVWRMRDAFHSFSPSCHIIGMQICIAWFASQIASLLPPRGTAQIWVHNCSYLNRVFDLRRCPPSVQPPTLYLGRQMHEHAKHVNYTIIIFRQQSFYLSTSTRFPGTNHAKWVRHEKLNTFPILQCFPNMSVFTGTRLMVPFKHLQDSHDAQVS